MKKLNYYLGLANLCVFIISFAPFIAAAEENKLDNQQLIHDAEKFIIAQLSTNSSAQLDVEGMPIDERIAIPICTQDIEYSVNAEALFQSNVTVRAQCPASNWYMYLMVRVTEIQPVVIVNNAVSPGTLLTRDNLQVIEMDKKRLRNTTFADIESVLGARVKRRLISGRPVEPDDLCFVCKGDSVVISAESQYMQVKTNGIALEDGNIGDTIRVKNSRSNKNLLAQIVSTHEVKVNL
ncbi:flagellar basal body P-ring formation chaperone FlgA [Paraglaciecola sp.]|uniref:flagellar basal body P-ring formation chaperone FlgA n=1 Tax=Paraglaciecola sp. TaxID=1920173 RepID=UPI0030F3BA42